MRVRTADAARLHFHLRRHLEAADCESSWPMPTVLDGMLTAEDRASVRDYDVTAMRAHVEKRRANIEIFRKSIAEEEAGIVKDQEIITYLEERARVLQD
jgi:hypothetical protein